MEINDSTFEKFNTLTEMTTKSGCFYHMRISQKVAELIYYNLPWLYTV